MNASFKRDTSVIVQINAQLLLASACATTAWLVWPSDYQAWQLGLMSGMLGLGALMALITALKSMAHLYERARTIGEFEALGGEQKSATLVSTEQLRAAGMVE